MKTVLHLHSQLMSNVYVKYLADMSLHNKRFNYKLD